MFSAKCTQLKPSSRSGNCNMRSFVLLVIVGVALLAAADAQQNYDGRNGPHEFGTPGNGVYIRGQNEGTYTVPGVEGTFQNKPKTGEHVYTDENGLTFYNGGAISSICPRSLVLSLVFLAFMGLITFN